MAKSFDPFDKNQDHTERSRMYDLIIIGAGPAGLTASIYASRYQLKHLVVGKSFGGEMALSHEIENYPGFRSISGLDLTRKMEEQAKLLGGEILSEGIAKIVPQKGVFKLTTESGDEHRARALILATGTERRKLGIPGEEEHVGKGVSYCSTCDAPFFRDKTVAVIGGANTAAQGALLLADIAKKIYVIYRRKPLRADPAYVSRIEKRAKQGKIKILYETNLTEIRGNGSRVTGVVLDRPYKGEEKLALDGVFIEAGGVPGTALVKPLGVKLDRKGFIKVDLRMGTSIPGLFAAGDITFSGALLQQIVTSCAQGAMAASSAYEFLKDRAAPSLRG
jgi:thioredoxin reductase (NADPH)